MKQNKVANVANKFYCEKCDYNTGRKSNYNKHLMTLKHQGKCIPETYETKAVANVANVANNFQCICGNVFNSRTTLWRHKNICNNTTNNIFTPKMFYDLLQQNNELTKQVIELSSKPTTTNNNTTNNNNNFNLNFFLNETCKDALNISEFISQLHVGIKDLEETGRLGYADGISKIFINGLKQLEVTQRPVHCSDGKRETIYIKDKNQWEKDDDEKVKLTKAIKSVAHKNIEQIAVWAEAHPEYMNYNSKYSEKYMKLIGEAMPGATYAESDKNYKKIARNITKETIINK